MSAEGSALSPGAHIPSQAAYTRPPRGDKDKHCVRNEAASASDGISPGVMSLHCDRGLLQSRQDGNCDRQYLAEKSVAPLNLFSRMPESSALPAALSMVGACLSMAVGSSACVKLSGGYLFCA